MCPNIKGTISKPNIKGILEMCPNIKIHTLPWLELRSWCNL